MFASGRSAAVLGPGIIFAATMLWATDAPFRVLLTENLSSQFIVLAEHAIDVLIALPLLVLGWHELKKLTRREWISVAIIAIGSSALALIAFTESFRYVNPSVAILLQKLQPFIAIFLAALILKETLAKRFWVWAFIAIGGAYLLSFPELVPLTYTGETWSPHTVGILLALAAAVLWAAGTVLGRYVLATLSFQTLTAVRFFGAFVFLLVWNVAHDTIPPLAEVSGTDWLFIAITAVASGIISLFLYYYGLRITRASIATIAELGFPLAAVLVNAYFIAGNNAPETVLGLFPLQWAGTILLLVALYRLSAINEKSIEQTA